VNGGGDRSGVRGWISRTSIGDLLVDIHHQQQIVLISSLVRRRLP
jgi:hypothetical protein